ncbi:hypothetical protein B0H67DRAFT_233442 [Lasiosphaeris hirsuta]|uniref:Uncharacterized protein n=1 Tax=Lasiosphaeris hirsuta TaxID=260670 RepID=A0AA40DX81_9PEZI|nr:hypothetical protein B0H67DRAFT_233442 [Lasiosphaeris hirsuta]
MSNRTESSPLLPIGSAHVQDHPIFLRVCHSPWSGISQTGLVYLRATILAYLTALGIMLLRYKAEYQINIFDEGEEAGGEFTYWQIIFQFSTLAFFFLWLYHLVAFSWSFTHLFYPDVDDNDTRWESRVLRRMSPPVQTIHSRKRFYFSLFYTVVHVVVFMNVIIYWTVLVPNGYGRFPEGEAEEDSSMDEFFGSGWFQPFCHINLWVVTALIAFIEILGLNSIRRQVPVASHVFSIMFILAGYLGWAAFGKILTGEYPYFWMDPEKMEYTEIVVGYSASFVILGAIVFAFIYGLIGMRENATRRDEPSQPFTNAVNFARDVARDIADDVREEFQRASGAQQR